MVDRIRAAWAGDDGRMGRSKGARDAMSRARDYRRDENGRGVDPFLKRKRRYRPVLRAVGAEALFAATPRGFQEAIWRGKLPEPRVVVGDGVEAWAGGVDAPNRVGLGRFVRRRVSEPATIKFD